MTPGAIRIKGVSRAQAQGLGSYGMNTTVVLSGKAVNASFRHAIPKIAGPIAISLWDKSERRVTAHEIGGRASFSKVEVVEVGFELIR